MPSARFVFRNLASLCVLASALPAFALSCNVRKSPMSPGDIAMARADYARAESLYTEESKSGPDADRTHAALIRAQLRQSKIAEAEKDAVAWSTAQPTNSWAMVSVAEVDWRKGDTDDAIKTLDKVRSTDYCNPQAHADVATVYRDDLVHFSYDPKRLSHCVAGVNIADCY